jgi:LacI family transcriptional regulator
MIRVILMMDSSSEFDRSLLKGMMRYSRENGPWAFYRLSSEYQAGGKRHAEVVELAHKWKVDAIIGRCDDEDLNRLDSLHIPIVLQNYKNRSTVYSNITGDYKGTGAMAAQYLYSKRCQDFAFFGIKGVLWSDERFYGYREQVERAGGQIHIYEIDDPVREDRQGIAAWLKSLPSGAAVFCCDDERALIITEICKIEGLDIPSRLSVLGVDNDELMCCISDPPLSSVQLDVERGGYMLCKCLDSQIRNPDSGHFNISISPVGVVERSSTSTLVSDPIVIQLLNSIDAHYTEDITVEQLLKEVPLSRRCVEYRFRKAMGTGIYQYIIDLRINRVAQLLRTTDRTMLDIASEAGIQDYNTLLRLFRKKKGCSPNDYRKGS